MNFVYLLLLVLFVILVGLKAMVLPVLAWSTVFMPLIIFGVIILSIVALLIWFIRKFKG